MSEKRLSLSANDNVRYQLKTPYRDGATHVIFEPLDFIARLVALVPKPRVNLTRFHGVLPGFFFRSPSPTTDEPFAYKQRAVQPPTRSG